MEIIDLLIILSTLVFSAFFSGVEIAFISANRLQIELDKKQGLVSGKILASFVQRQSRFIGAMLVGNNISLVIYGIFMAKVLEPYIVTFSTNGVFVLVTQTLLSTLVILVTAEFLPKTLFRINPNIVLRWFSPLIWAFYYLLWVPTWFIIGLSEAALKLLFKVDLDENNAAFGRVDLDYYVKEAAERAQVANEEVETEVQIFQNALDFSSVKARECMIPRTEIEALDINSPIDELISTFIKTGFSKILIFRGTIDNIIGYTHSFELFKSPNSIKEILLPVGIFPESMPANEALEHFIENNRSIAVVVDEFGGTAGILTIEDVVEEIFGEIEDEHDKETMVEREIATDEFEFSARLEIDYLNDKYKLNLPESDEYETLAGYMIHLFENIPSESDTTSDGSWDYTVIEVAENKIELVGLQKVHLPE